MNINSEKKYDLIVACIGNSELDENIIDTAYKKARLSGCTWHVLNIVNNKVEVQLQSKAQRLIKRAIILKAKVIKLTAPTISGGIIQYARTLEPQAERVLFLIGSHKTEHLYKYFRKSVYNKIKTPLKELEIELDVVAHERDKNNNFAFISPIFNLHSLAGMAEAVIYTVTATFAAFCASYIFPIKPENSHSNIFLIYFFACLISSIRAGFIPGLLSAVLSVVTVLFFFLKPEKSFALADHDHVYNLIVFTILVSAVSLIGSGTRRYIIEAKRKEAYLNALLNVSETLNRPLNESEAVSYIYHELEKLFATEIALFTPSFMDNSKLELCYPKKIKKLSKVEQQAFDTCHADFRSTGFLTSTYPDSKWYFEPMMAAAGFQGILAVKLAESPLRYEPDVISILLGFADLSATIIDRIEHTQVLETTRIGQEKEKLRTMILSSVSHDLKTPLASIIGALDIYHNLSEKLSPQAKLELTKTSLQEARRLDSFVTNILDMAKLESGSIKFSKDWHLTKPIIDKALQNAAGKLNNRPTKITGGSYEIEVDQNMLLRALANLFDNISKYTPENSPINIQIGPDNNGNFSILIQDFGPGIDELMLESVFNKYTRIEKKDNKIAGTGLGLPIARSIVESHGGTVSASNNKDEQGSIFKITLPNYRLAPAAH